MASVINTNVASLNAQRHLSKTQTGLESALQRLSSGLRINSAKDDAAGLAIASRFTAQINGLNQAARNANDGISLAQTAEGALDEVSNNLQRLRELAVQSSNATNTASDRASLQAEANQRIAEITRVASQTQFNGLNLLDGTFTTQNFQVGANANQVISVTSISDSRASALGSHSLVADGTITGSTVVSATAVSTGNGVGAETDLTLTNSAGTTAPISYAANSGANQVASAINAAGSGLGITASASNSTTLASLSAAGTVTFNLVGGTSSAAVSAVIASQNDLSNLVSAINGVQTTTGVTASFTSAGSKASITLSTTDGRNISIDTFNNTAGGAGDTVVFGGSTLTDGAAATANAVVTGTVAISSSQGPLATANANADVFTAAGVNNSAFTSVAALDLSSYSGAQAAIAGLDAALAQVNSSRGDIGAYQNRFMSAIATLQTASENLSASRSRIMDADFAAETANLTRSQILQQAGTAMLAQANALPQSVLALLK